MIMQDRSKRLSEPLRWGRREKAVVASLLACVVLAAIGLGIFALTSGSREPSDCVDVTFAGTLGAARLHACGARAKTMCASPGTPKEILAPLRTACRRAGYSFDRAAASIYTNVETRRPSVGHGVPSRALSLPVS
jgi:hypothetical protein